jgi:two-component system NtrC family sensor kinase
MNTTSNVAELRPRLLVIEDEPSVAAFLHAALDRRGYEVVPADSAEAGLRALAERDFHGVISDFRTPGALTGADVHQWVREHRPELANRFVFITGDIASDETIFLLAKAGTPCIEKPFRVQQLIDAVEKTMGKL